VVYREWCGGGGGVSGVMVWWWWWCIGSDGVVVVYREWCGGGVSGVIGEVMVYREWWCGVGVSVLPSVECKQPCKTTGVEDDEYLTIAKVWGNKISAPHTAQNSIKGCKWHTNRNGYGNFAQRIRANQLSALKLGFFESRNFGSFIYPWIPIAATQNTD
jgi:hypothetical protein